MERSRGNMVRSHKSESVQHTKLADGQHFRELFWQTLGRMVVLYFMPLVLLAIFFQVQYRRLLIDSLRAHLEVIAEHQANTFDLFLRERMVNLANIIDDPMFASAESDESVLPGFLEELRHTSEAFVDLGCVSQDGYLESYVGPVDFSDSISYMNEDWFQQLVYGDKASVITEVYLGFRG